MGRCYPHLNLEERRKLAKWLEAKLAVKEIADNLHRAGLGVDPWFCDPQSPWQKGTVENTNNRLRRYLPRKADPTAFTNRYLKSICARLNATPPKCPGYQPPAEVFRAKLLEGKPGTR